MNYIDNLIELAKEKPSLVFLNKKVKKKKEIAKQNKKRYWKLSASERLHYDSVIERINTFSLFQIFSTTLVFIFSLSFMLLFVAIIKFLVVLETFQVLFIVFFLLKGYYFLIVMGFAIDIFFLLKYIFFSRPRAIKKLNKNYGFK